MSKFFFKLLPLIVVFLTSTKIYSQDLSIGTGTTFSLGGSTLKLKGNWNNFGTFYSGSGTIIFNNAIGNQTINNSSGETFINLTVNKASGDVQLANNITVNGTLTNISGDIDLNSHTLIFADSGILIENQGSTIKGSGILTTTKILNNPSENILGLEIISSANLGSTIINRAHTVQNCNGNTSILRYYEVVPTNNTELNANLVFHYDESELNELIEDNLIPYQSFDNGENWEIISDYSLNTTENTVSINNISSLARITLAAPLLPLSPKLTSLTQCTTTSFNVSGIITNNPEQNETVQYYFIYGTDAANLDQSTVSAQITINAGEDAVINETIGGLTIETKYYCKLVANSTQSNSKEIYLSSLRTTNLKMRLRADLNVISSNSLVAQWGDASGNGNDAIQLSGVNQPTLFENIINGKPVVRFNGTNSKMTLPTSSELGIQSNPYELFIVAKSSSSDIQFLISGGSYEQFEYHLNGAAGARFIPTTLTYIDEGATTIFTDGKAHVFSARAQSSGGTVRVDGVDGGTSASNPLSANNGNLLLGVRSGGSYFLNGDIAEILLYNAVLTSEERNTVEQYFSERYGITSGALPVELTSFTASAADGKVLLNWQTATEINNYGFEIERKNPNNLPSLEGMSEGQGWVLLGFVPGHGNSNSPKNYEFIDADPPAGKLQYRLKQIDTDGKYEYYGTIAEVDLSVSDIQDHEVIPTEYGLSQNYPNPFNPSTAIRYQIPSVDALSSVEVLVTLKIYDTLGREVATLVNEQKAPGHYEVQFDGSRLASGIYLYKLQSGSYSSTKKLMLLK